MEKIVKIGNTEVRMRASALSPVLFRREFNSDLITESAKAIGNGTLTNTDIIGQMAYIFAKQCDSEIPSFEEWLDTFELMDLLEASVDIVNVWLDSQKKTSKTKK